MHVRPFLTPCGFHHFYLSSPLACTLHSWQNELLQVPQTWYESTIQPSPHPFLSQLSRFLSVFTSSREALLDTLSLGLSSVPKALGLLHPGFSHSSQHFFLFPCLSSNLDWEGLEGKDCIFHCFSSDVCMTCYDSRQTSCWLSANVEEGRK